MTDDTVNELPLVDADGFWVITTESGYYLLDLAAMTICRLATDTSHINTVTGEHPLRRDGEMLPLIAGPIRVGERLVVGAVDHHDRTTRRTTPVTQIRRLAP